MGLGAHAASSIAGRVALAGALALALAGCAGSPGVSGVDAGEGRDGAADAGALDAGAEDGGDAGDDADADGGDASASCGDLAVSLGAASPGDVLTLRPECAAELGPVALHVPAGVTLRAEHVRTTPFDVVISGTGAEPAITLEPSADAALPTTLSGIEVRSPGRAAIVARGEGHVRIADVRVDITAGIGIGLERATATIADTAIHSDFSSARRDEEPVPADGARVGTWGIVASDAADVTLIDSGASSFADGCVAIVGASARATGSRFFACRTHGVLAYGASLELTGVTLDNHYRRTGSTSRALAIAGGSTLVADGLDVHDCEGEGVFVDGASDATLAALAARTLGGAAVWAQRGASIGVSALSSIEGASGGGIVAIGAAAIDVRDTSVRLTAASSLARAGGGSASFGDGVVIAGIVMPPTIQLTDVMLEGNARVGLLIDGGGLAIPTLALARVSVSGTGAQLGAIAQAVMGLPAGWDAGVTRDAVTAANDAAAGVLDVPAASAGIVMPPTITF